MTPESGQLNVRGGGVLVSVVVGSQLSARQPAKVGTYHAEGGQLHIGGGGVLVGVVGEHSGAVEGAVVLGEVQPALEPVGALAAHADAHDVRGAAQSRGLQPVCSA